MRELGSDEARRDFRALLDEVEHDPAAAVRISRYDRPVAVLVSEDLWRAAVEDALSHAEWLALAGKLRAARYAVGLPGRRHPVDKRVVNHINGDRTNNDPGNLEVVEVPEGEQ